MPKTDRTIETFSPQEYLELTLFDSIAYLADKNISTKRLPYSGNPMAKNCNVVSGHSLTSIQSVQLELADSLNGNTEQKWIFGADAAAAGLELVKEGSEEYEKKKKENPDYNTEPIFLAAKTPKLSVQSAYLLNQFTDESINRALHGTSEEITSLTKVVQSAMRSEMVLNGTTKKELELRHNKRVNFAQNYTSEKTKNTVKKTLKKIRENLSLGPEESKCFYTCMNYFAQQNGCAMKMNEKATQKDFMTALENLGSEFFSKMCFHAHAVSERLSHYQFMFEPVYSKAEAELSETAGCGWILPEASKMGSGKTATRNKSIPRLPQKLPSQDVTRSRAGFSEVRGR